MNYTPPSRVVTEPGGATFRVNRVERRGFTRTLAAMWRSFALFILFVQDAPAGLTDGVKEIGSPGVPGTIACWGPTASPVVVDANGRAVVAVATWGKGRVALWAHDGFASAGALKDKDTGRLLENVLRWCAGKEGKVGLWGGDTAAFVRGLGFEPVKLDGVGDLKNLKAVMTTHVDVTDAERAALDAFVAEGGGLVAFMTGWGWAQIRKRGVIEAGFNRLFAPAGIGFTGEYADDSVKDGFAAGAVSPLSHAKRALDALSGKGDLKLAARSAIDAFHLLPADDKHLRPAIDALLKERGGAIVPTEKKPLTAPLDRFLLAVQLEGRTEAHPAAEGFPGLPGKAEPVDVTRAIDTSIPEWHSTGLYAAPGATVKVTIPKEAAKAGLVLQIGAHTDELWSHDKWRRAPSVTRRFPMLKESVEAASPFGGLVYIDVPGNCRAGKVEVGIAGAIESPLYVRGVTTKEQWAAAKSRPAPWGELATSKVVVTVPASELKDIDDPEPLLKLWDELMDAAAELGAIDAKRRRAERYVADVQISAGYMHSGYPIMTHLDAARAMSHVEVLRKGNWGLFHELGHNHQRGDWTFEGTGEVTNNLWSLYLSERIGVKDAHPALKEREKRIKAYRDGGSTFEAWKADPFLALVMYQQLQEAFGWDAFKKVFAEYEGLARADRPKNDDEKRDQWMVRFSKAVGRNLGPFFEAWGVPVSAGAREAVSGLPEWKR
jgi:hypothetical protein